MSKNFSGDLRDSATGIFFTPEGNHEAWQITRYEKSVQCETWQRNGRGRSAYYGHVNWLFLSDSTGSPNADMAMPELIEVGLAQPRPGGYLDLKVSENEKAPFHELCVLICPEQHHEGWNRIWRSRYLVVIAEIRIPKPSASPAIMTTSTGARRTYQFKHAAQVGSSSA